MDSSPHKNFEENTTVVLMQSREMVSAEDGHRSPRTARLLRPTSGGSTEGLIIKKSDLEPQEWGNVRAKFCGWLNPTGAWKEWVASMKPHHRNTWENAGILEAIEVSTYTIRQHTGIILGMAEKWCSDTNTFVFHWGESTIGLEDLMVLGGYSVTGECLLTPDLIPELESVVEKLETARMDLVDTTAKKATHKLWIDKFKGTNSEIEHEAFLALWLSRFVFPVATDTVSPVVFPLASRLARGVRIALAPAILCSIYRDLGKLKATIRRNATSEIKIFSPFQLLLVWVWERFIKLRPTTPQLPIPTDEVRLSRWHKLRRNDMENVRMVIRSIGPNDFYWRPYATDENHFIPKRFYCEREEVVYPSKFGEELKAFVWCMRPSELLGLDGVVKQYLPHRVARQFGMDQDLPGYVPRENWNKETVWGNYTRSIKDLWIRIPPQNHQGSVTGAYEVWTKLLTTPDEAVTGVERNEAKTIINISSDEEGGVGCNDFPPGFPPKRNSRKRSIQEA